MANKLLPYHYEAEKVVLGSMISDRNVLSQIENLLDEESFRHPLHQRIWQAIRQVDRRGDSPDMIAVMAELSKEPEPFDAFEFSQVATSYSEDFYQHACYVSELGKRRQLIRILEVFLAQAYAGTTDLTDLLGGIEEQLKALFEETQDQVHTLDEAIRGVLQRMEKNAAGGEELTGTPTGFRELDRLSGGLQKSDLIVVAGDTSQGKTSLSVSIARHAAMQGTAIAFYSLEMKKEQIAARMMAMQSGVAANKILYAPLKPIQFEAISEGVSKLLEAKIYFDDRSTSHLDTIIHSICSLKKKYHIDGAVVDYLQILNVNMRESKKEAQMAEAARRLKNLAKDLDIWIMALSQLNRDPLHLHPTLSRLRDSGQIGEAADVVLLIHRPEVYGLTYRVKEFEHIDPKGTAMIDMAKGRNIGIHKFICGFDASTTRFYDLKGGELPLAPPGEEEPF